LNHDPNNHTMETDAPDIFHFLIRTYWLNS